MVSIARREPARAPRPRPRPRVSTEQTLGHRPGYPPSSKHEGATPLSQREVEVLRLVAEGCSNRAIAAALSLSERTVTTYVFHILAKLDLPSRTAAAVYAVRQGLV